MKANEVFMLVHIYEHGEENQYTESKLIGIFSSPELANLAIEPLFSQPGFRDHPRDCFIIDPYTLDEAEFTEGFDPAKEMEWLEDND